MSVAIINSSCPICLDEFSTITRKTKVIECGHKFCLKCITTHFKYQAQLLDSDFKCPDPSCNTYINPKGILGAKWMRHKRKLIQNKVDLSQKINCPKTNCKGEISDANICTSCGSSICLKCRELSHSGECKKEIVESIKTKNKTTKKCPQCKSPIEKNKGCDHMHCANCGCDFSWNTLLIMGKGEIDEGISRSSIKDRPVLYLSSNPEEAKPNSAYPIVKENEITMTPPNPYVVPIVEYNRTVLNRTGYNRRIVTLSDLM